MKQRLRQLEGNRSVMVIAGVKARSLILYREMAMDAQLINTGNKKAHLFEIRDEAMKPLLNQGDYVICNVYDKTPKDGAICLFMADKEGLVVRKLRIIEGRYCLIAENPLYEPIYRRADSLGLIASVERAVVSITNQPKGAI